MFVQQTDELFALPGDALEVKPGRVFPRQIHQNQIAKPLHDSHMVPQIVPLLPVHVGPPFSTGTEYLAHHADHFVGSLADVAHVFRAEKDLVTGQITSGSLDEDCELGNLTDSLDGREWRVHEMAEQKIWKGGRSRGAVPENTAIVI